MPLLTVRASDAVSSPQCRRGLVKRHVRDIIFQGDVGQGPPRFASVPRRP